MVVLAVQGPPSVITYSLPLPRASESPRTPLAKMMTMSAFLYISDFKSSVEDATLNCLVDAVATDVERTGKTGQKREISSEHEALLS